MQAEIAPLPYKTVELPDRSVGIAVRYLNEEQTFSALQVTSMLFTKLKLTAEQALGIKVNDVVIGVSKNMDIRIFFFFILPVLFIQLKNV